MVHMNANRPSLVVNRDTDLATAKDFLDKANHDGKKVYGKRDQKTGVLTLYIKTGSNRLDVLRGRHTQKQQLGRTGLETIFNNQKTLNEGGRMTAKGAEANRLVFGHLSNSIKGDGALTVRDVKERQALAAKIPVRLSQGSPAPAATPAQHGPAPLVTNGPQSFHLAQPTTAPSSPTLQAIDTTLSGLPTGTTPTAQQLGSDLARHLTQTHPNRADRFALALADNSTLKADLKVALKAHLDVAQPNHALDDAALDALADQAVTEAFGQLTNASTAPGPDVQITVRHNNQTSTVSLPPITVGGKQFTPHSFVRQGGFGQIFEYRAQDGSKAAVKIPIKMDMLSTVANPDAQQLSELRTEARKEIDAHLAVEGNGHPNVLRLEGALRLPNDNIAIVMEYSDYGSLDDLREAMHDGAIKGSGNPPPTGTITAEDMETITLTMMGDMIEGVDHMNRTQGLIGFDTKSANALLMGGGKAVVNDFGTAISASSVNFREAPTISVTFKAPEMDTAPDRFAQAVGRQDAALKGSFQALINDDAMFDALATAIVEDTDSNTDFTDKVDVWGLGTSLVSMLSDQHIQWSNDLFQFGGGTNGLPQGAPGAAAVQPRQGNGTVAPGALFGSLGGSPLTDAFANRMLHPDAAQRPAAWQLKGDPALQQAGVGSQQARDLAIAVVAMKRANASGDAAQITAAQQDLDTKRNALHTFKATLAAAPPPPPFTPPVFRTSVNLSASQAAAATPDLTLEDLDETLAMLDALTLPEDGADTASTTQGASAPATETIFNELDQLMAELEADMAADRLRGSQL